MRQLRLFVSVALTVLAVSCTKDLEPKKCTVSDECPANAVCETGICAALPAGECRLPAACSVPTNSTATCINQTCGYTCDTGFNLCSQQCTPDSIDSCGSGCKACPKPPNGNATCSAGQCGAACDNNFQACPTAGGGWTCSLGACCSTDQVVCASSGCCTPITSVAAGGDHACALNSAKNVLCWGANNLGQLGIGTQGSSVSVPGFVFASGTTPLGDIVALSSGFNHSCAVTSSQGVKCWGRNNGGQLGNNTTTDSPSPVDVLTSNGTTLSNVVAVAAGYTHTCALLTGGGVKCWGIGLSGQLGYNSPTSSSVAVDVCADSTCASSLTGATAIAVGLTHSCALMGATGGVKCWGYNWYGIGDGSSGTGTVRVTPVDVSDGNGHALAGVQAISAGANFTCAIATQGTLCWGYNGDGELGIAASTTKASIPTAAPVSSSASIASLSEHTCVTTSAGSVQCWGLDTAGETGNNSKQAIAAPSFVVDGFGGKLVGVKQVSAGGNYSCALKTDGSVVCWGDNSIGQLGDGTTTSRLTPVSVALQH